MTADPIKELRDEFASQFKTLKDSYESDKQANEATIQALKEENEELKRALIRSAVTPQETPAAAPTEEEIYASQIESLSRKTLSMMQDMH